MARLSLNLLGGFELREERGSALSITVKKAKALLAYLALHPGTAFSRDRLATMLWEDSTDAQARHSLRQALSALRRALPDGDAILTADAETVAVAAGSIDVDVVEFEQLVREGVLESLERAVEMLRGELLEGLNPRSMAYEDWLAEQRSALRERAARALATLVEAHEAAGRHERAIRAAVRLVAFEPLDEDAHRRLMRLYAGQRRFGDALRQYRRCRAILRRELEVAPDPKTEKLHAQIIAERRTSNETGAPGQARPGELEPGRAPVERELRPLVLLVARLETTPVDLDPESYQAAQSTFEDAVDQALHRWGGRLARRLGRTRVVAFGVPRAHSNDAERGLRAAAEIHQRLRAAGSPPPALAARIGLASGLVLTASCTTEAEECELNGDPVDRAAALCDGAEAGSTLISGAVRRSAATAVDARQERAGGRGGDPPWRVISVHPPGALPERAPLVGRRAQRRLLETALDIAADSGSGQTVLLRGEAGIGKSRLLEEAGAVAGARGFSCHRSMVLDFGTEIDHDPLRALGRSLLGLADDSVAESVARAIHIAHAGGMLPADELASAYDLLGVPAPVAQRAELDAMDDGARRRGRERALGRLVAARSMTQPLFLAVEDVHWAEPETLAELAALVTAVANTATVLVLTHRVEDEPLDPSWRGATRGAPLTTIDLAPLKEEEALALAEQLAGGRSEFARRCAERAGGHPLYLEQLIGSGAPDAGVPGGIRSIVQARLDVLGDRDRRAAQAAAVLGQRFALDALRRVLDDGDYAPDGLVDERFVRADADRFQFAHALIMESIYDSTLDSRRRVLHARAAVWFRDRDPTLHAEHLDRAGDQAAARAYCEAARGLVAAHRADRASSLLARGLEIATEDGDRFDLLCLRADLARDAGDTEAAIRDYEQALEHARNGVAPVRAWLGIAAAWWIRDRHEQAFAALDHAQRSATTDAHLAEVHALRGQVLFPLGHTDACLAEQQQAHEHARRSRSPELLAWTLSGLGDAYYQRGHMRTAFDHFEQCLALCRQHGFGKREAANLSMRAGTRFYLNDVSGALEDGRQALELAERVGNRRAEVVALDGLATLLPYTADWKGVRKHATRGAELARAIGARRFAIDLECFQLWAQAELGDLPDADQRVEAVYREGHEVVDTFSGPWLLAIVAVVTRDRERRRRALAEGERLLAAPSLSHNHLHFHQLAIECALEDAAWDEAERHAVRLEAYTSSQALPWTDLVMARARALAAHGRAPSAGARDAVRPQLEGVRARCAEAGLVMLLPALDRALGV